MNKPGVKLGLWNKFMAIDWSAHRGWLLALYLLLGVILLAPVWTVRYPPLIDYPNHLASAFVLAHLKDPRFHFSEFYASNWNLGPYLTMDLILLGLQKFLPIAIVGRVLLSICLIAVPLGVWFFLREANPGEERLAFWSLLLCNNVFFFLYGFLNLQLSFALCFFALGLWLRYLNRPRPALWGISIAAMTVLYFTHIVGFGMAGIIVTAYLLLARRSVGEMLRSWALFLPGIVLYISWSVRDPQRWTIMFRSLTGKVEGFVAIMLGYSPSLDFLTLLILLGAILFAWADNPEFRWNYRWLAVLACLCILYAVFPANYGPGKMADRRLLPFIFVVALAGAKVGRRGMYLLPVALFLFVLRTGNVEKNFLSMQPHLENLAQSFSAIPENARVFPFILHRTDNPLPEDHFWAYGVINRGWFSPCLFHDKGVQPFRIRLHTYVLNRSPIYLSFREEEPINWAKIKTDYDYVWAYGAPEYSARFAAMGKQMFASDGLQVYQLSKK